MRGVPESKAPGAGWGELCSAPAVWLETQKVAWPQFSHLPDEVNAVVSLLRVGPKEIDRVCAVS